VLMDDLVLLGALGRALGDLEIGLVATDLRTSEEYANDLFARMASAEADKRRFLALLRAQQATLPKSQPQRTGTTVAMRDVVAVTEVEAGPTRFSVTIVKLGSWMVGVIAPVAPWRGGVQLPPPFVLAERHGFTVREAEVATLLATGLTNLEIASKLGISPFTARRHTERVLMKAGVKSRSGIAALLLGFAGDSRRAG
jgi:DNA-binding CsgD family transcriptional regulator